MKSIEWRIPSVHYENRNFSIRIVAVFSLRTYLKIRKRLISTSQNFIVTEYLSKLNNNLNKNLCYFKN